ncbi:uncharacterized protein LOC123033590 [Varanus komodoensis]|uniref:uncharacterized protein LOC123033590 n=1 Tax=Varanus komodoensis TaxID=61221 RepID=UPI001CF7722E|nr:uncharacterized protein LOC123033590 [Varanus komodoensis]
MAHNGGKGRPRPSPFLPAYSRLPAAASVCTNTKDTPRAPQRQRVSGIPLCPRFSFSGFLPSCREDQPSGRGWGGEQLEVRFNDQRSGGSSPNCQEPARGKQPRCNFFLTRKLLQPLTLLGHSLNVHDLQTPPILKQHFGCSEHLHTGSTFSLSCPPQPLELLLDQSPLARIPSVNMWCMKLRVSPHTRCAPKVMRMKFLCSRRAL